MIMFQNNEGTWNGPKYVTMNFPITSIFNFSHPLGFNVITECTLLKNVSCCVLPRWYTLDFEQKKMDYTWNLI